MYIFHPTNTANVLGAGTVGVRYSGNNKPSPYEWLTSLLSPGLAAHHPHTG